MKLYGSESDMNFWVWISERVIYKSIIPIDETHLAAGTAGQTV